MFGPGESRFVEEKRHFEKPVPISDLVLLDRGGASSAVAALASPRRSRATRSSTSASAAPTPRSSPTPTSRSRPTSPATPCRSARWARHRELVPLPRPAVGPPDRRDVVHHLRGGLPRRAAEHVEPHRPPARGRLRAGEPGLALRQGSLRRRVGALGGARRGRRWCARTASWSRCRGPRRSTPRPRGCRARSTPTDPDRSRCSAARAAATRTPTSGRAWPRACSAPTTSTRNSATGSRPRSCSACPAPPSPTSTAPAASCSSRPTSVKSSRCSTCACDARRWSWACR